MSKYKLFLISFGFYLGLSPIYWLPSIPALYLILIKYSLFAFICFYSIFFTLKNSSAFTIRFPGRYVVFFSILLMIILVLVPFSLGYNSSNINTIVNLFQILFFLIASRVVIEVNQVLYVIKLSLSILSFFVSLSVLLMLFVPMTVNPLNNELYLIDTGFGGLRTSWSPAIGLFMPFILMFSNSVIIFLLYLFSQLLTGGRTGFFLSVLMIIPLFHIEKNWRIKFRFIIIFTLIFFAILTYNPSYLSSFRAFESLNGNNDLDSLSSGRVSLLNEALFSISESPFIGYATQPFFVGDSVHNVFLRGWVYYGFLYFLCSIIIVIYIVSKSLIRIKSSKNSSDKKLFIILSLVLIYGCVVGMFEPSIIFGNFTNFSVWWFAFALVASNRFMPTKENI